MRRRILVCALLTALWGGVAAADQLSLATDHPEREGTLAATYRLDRRVTATGTLHVEWSDALGRLVERRSISVALADSGEISFSLDLRRAVAARNRISAWLSLRGGKDVATPGSEVALDFTARPIDPWRDFQVIMWQPHDAAQFANLKRTGFTSGMVIGNRDDPQAPIERQVEPMLRNDLRWYVENIATDLYASYHRWTPGRAVNWRFLEAQQRYRDNPADRTAFVREPSLSDPAWLGRIAERLQHIVRRHAPYRPLFYSLGDEVGIADLAAFWDFDLSDHSLAGMRLWLQGEYGKLAALNMQWGTNFATWDAVVPMTTADAMRRDDDNFSAWADFKAWMDEAFARALRAGTAAVHAADPRALAGIEGGQIPGWGGYDYVRLSKAVDLIELYDFGDNVELMRAFNPEVILLGGLGGGDAASRHALWRGVLRGLRGVMVWDDKHNFAREDGGPGPEAAKAQPDLQRVQAISALLAAARRHIDPVGILYSPASFRTQWMLDWKSRGDAWSRRSAEDEYAEDAVRAAPSHYARLLRQMGLQHRFLSTEMLEADVLQRDGVRVLILPNAIALSPAAAMAIRGFVEQGGTVIADSMPGAFDLHSRRLSAPLLADLFDADASDRTVGHGHAVRLPGLPGSQSLEVVAPLVERAGVKPPVAVRRANGAPASDVEVSLFRHGEAMIVALQSATPKRAQAEAAVLLQLPQAAQLYDLGAGRALGLLDRLELTLDPVVPTLLVAAPTELAVPQVTVGPKLRRGETAVLDIEAAGDVLRVETFDPAGAAMPHYSGVLHPAAGKVTWQLPLALNDATGTWRVVVTDLLSGQVARAEIGVIEP